MSSKTIKYILVATLVFAFVFAIIYKTELSLFSGISKPKDLPELLEDFADEDDAEEKVYLATRIVMAKINQEVREITDKNPVPSLSEEQISQVEEAKAYLKKADQITSTYMSKIPLEELERIHEGVKDEIVALGFKDDFGTPDLISATSSYYRNKPCTDADFEKLITRFSKETIGDAGMSLVGANLGYTGAVAAQTFEPLFEAALKQVENSEDKKIVIAFKKLTQLGSPSPGKEKQEGEIVDSDQRWKKYSGWDQTREIFFEARRTAPACFDQKNMKTFLEKIRVVKTELVAERLFPKVIEYYNKNKALPEDLEKIDGLNSADYRDAWHSKFTAERKDSKIKLISLGPDRKANSSDDFSAYSGSL